MSFEPILTLWNHQRTKTSDETWPDWPTGTAVYADATHVVTLRNQEIERIGGEAFESIGALLMFGLTKPVKMPLPNSRYPCDAVLAQITEKPDRYQSDMERAEVRAIFQKARQKYEGIALKAEEFWPD